MDRADFNQTNEALRAAGLRPLTEKEAGVLPPAPPPRPAEPLPSSAPPPSPQTAAEAPVIERPEEWKRVPWPVNTPRQAPGQNADGLGGRGPEAFARGARPGAETAPDTGPLELALEGARTPEELRAVIQRAAAEGHITIAQDHR